MARTQVISSLGIAVLVAIGCGGSKPQAASATSDTHTQEVPLQLAQAPVESGTPASSGSASIRGTIQLEGAAPTPEKVKMDADPMCQQQHASPVYSEEVAVNSNGTLKNVFIYVKEGVRGVFPTPATAVTLDQAGCWYHPHVFGIHVNQPLEIVNSDATLHNVNAKPINNQPFNVAQPVKGMKTTKKFAQPEIMVKFKCNVHPWMNAYAGVVEHPFFSISGEDGSFAITGLPAGAYVLEAWHEKYGTQTQTVSVGDGEAKSIEFIFKAQ